MHAPRFKAQAQSLVRSASTDIPPGVFPYRAGLTPLRDGRAPLTRRIYGRLDPAFGTEGRINAVIGGSDDNGWGRAVAITRDSRIVAGGEVSSGVVVSGRFALIRVTPRGRIDPKFGAGGVVTTDFGAVSSIRGLVLQHDGKIVAGGSSAGEIALARYLGRDPSPSGKCRRVAAARPPIADCNR